MGKKILFVDDSSSMRQVVGLAMQKYGYEVTTAVDGVEGTARLDDQRYDVIITGYDLNLMYIRQPMVRRID